LNRILTPGDPITFPFELGGIFLGILAYPKSIHKQDRYASALIWRAVKEMASNPGRYGELPEIFRLACLMPDLTEIERELNRGAAIISRERLPAIKWASCELHAHVCNYLGIPHPKKVPSHASAEMLAALSRDLKREDRPRDRRGPKSKRDRTEDRNILTRVWRPSLPVLHIALALDVAIGGDPVLLAANGANIGDILFDPALCLRLIEESEIIRPFIAEKFQILPKDQLSIILMRKELGSAKPPNLP